MDSEFTTKAIAKEAWNQLVLSIAADIPPSGMSVDYYFTVPGKGLFPLEEQLKRLETYKYKLGTENIEAGMRSGMHSQVVPTNKLENRQGIEYIQDCMRSIGPYELVQATEYENKQGIENIQDGMRSIALFELAQENKQQGIENIRDDMRSIGVYELVQENQPGIENIQDPMRSIGFYELVQANEHENLQERENIRDCMTTIRDYEVGQANEHQGIQHNQDGIKSTAEYEEPELDAWLIKYFDQLLEFLENGELHGREKPTIQSKSLQLIILLHHYGVETIQSAVEEELEKVNQKYNDIENIIPVQFHEEDPFICSLDNENLPIQFRKRSLEVMLRICNTQTCQTTIYEIIGKAARNQLVIDI